MELNHSLFARNPLRLCLGIALGNLQYENPVEQSVSPQDQEGTKWADLVSKAIFERAVFNL